MTLYRMAGILVLLSSPLVLAHEPEDCDCMCLDQEFEVTAQEAEVIEDVKRGVNDLDFGDRDQFFRKIRKDLEEFERIEQRSK